MAEDFAPASIAQNPFLQQYLAQRVDGKSMRALRLERESLLAALEATGQAQPATILNFNPVPLVLDGGIAQTVPKIPSIVDEAVRDEDRISIQWRGKNYKATILTIRKPLLFPWITDCKNVDGEAVGIYKMAACKQIEMANNFLVAYTNGTPSSSGMGGVIAFEGDRHALQLKSAKDFMIRVPTFIRLPNGLREYTTEAQPFSEVLDKMLSTQKSYARRQTQEAQNYWDQEDQRGNITPVHRIWHQYEMDMGYRHTVAPWVTLQNEPEQTCEGCGTPRKRATAYFCHNCQRPYDPLKAYLAGEMPLNHPSMNRIKEADWAIVRKEEERRKKMREGIA